jgi:hypothetical protein
MVHGAVLPPHLLVQKNEHGVRLIGYGSAGLTGEPLSFFSVQHQGFYPDGIKLGSSLVPKLDLVMSARCIVALLGGNPATAVLPESVPIPLAKMIQRVALSKLDSSEIEHTWTLREELGAIASKVFGAPEFVPIVMPT